MLKYLMAMKRGQDHLGDQINNLIPHNNFSKEKMEGDIGDMKLQLDERLTKRKCKDATSIKVIVIWWPPRG